MPNVKNPMSVNHINFSKTDDFAKLVIKAAKATHMSRGEAALLAYYAACSTGHTPAAKHIAERVGCTEPHVYVLRRALQSKGIITLIDNKIYVDWKRIKVFASLNPRKTTKGQFVRPQNPTIMDRILGAQQVNDKFLKVWKMSLNEIIVYFGSMTNAEYNAWRSGYKKFIAAIG